MIGMRIHAEVDVVNRQIAFLKKALRSFPLHYGNHTHRQLAAQGMKKSGKRCKSQLAIGRKPLAEDGQEVAYLTPLNILGKGCPF